MGLAAKGECRKTSAGQRLGLPQFPKSSYASLPLFASHFVIQHLWHLHSWMDHRASFKHVGKTHVGFRPGCLSSTQIGSTPLYWHGTIRLHALQTQSESNVSFPHFDPPSKLFDTRNWLICAEKSKSKVAFIFFLPCCVKASKWCVLGRWNSSVDTICLSVSTELIEARPSPCVPPLSLYLHLQGQPTSLGQDVFFPLFFWLPLGFRWAFVAFAGTMQAVGCSTMQCSESMGREKKVMKSLHHVMQRTVCYLWEKKKLSERVVKFKVYSKRK